MAPVIPVSNASLASEPNIVEEQVVNAPEPAQFTPVTRGGHSRSNPKSTSAIVIQLNSFQVLEKVNREDQPALDPYE